MSRLDKVRDTCSPLHCYHRDDDDDENHDDDQCDEDHDDDQGDEDHDDEDQCSGDDNDCDCFQIKNLPKPNCL